MKTYKICIIATILGIVILARICLPYAILRYAEYRINKIPEYHVHISDIDVSLLRGSYLIKDIHLEKTSQHIPVPFFTAKSVLLQIQWQALWHGKFVGAMQLNEPTVNFVSDPSGKAEQLTIDQEWQNAVQALFPLNFNEIIIHQGSLHFQNFDKSSPFDLYLKNTEATLTNLQQTKSENSSSLLSELIVHANTMDGAPVYLEMHFSPIAKRPTFKLIATLKGLNVREANNFLQQYTKIKVRRGWFSLYVEAAARNGKIKAYAKPFFKNLSIVEPQSNNPIEVIYKSVAKAATKLLENPQDQTVATKIEISGDIEDPNISLWSMITNILRHAFLQALMPQIDHSVKMQNL